VAGAPPKMWAVLSAHPQSPGVDVTVVWQGKEPTRLPEVIWWTVRPAESAVDADSWRLSKSGSWIRPDEVRPHSKVRTQADRALQQTRPPTVAVGGAGWWGVSSLCGCGIQTSSHLLSHCPGAPQVVLNGSFSLHALDDSGVRVDSACGRQRLRVVGLDTPLVSPGEATALPNLSQAPDMSAGVSFNLFNNLWVRG